MRSRSRSRSRARNRVHIKHRRAIIDGVAGQRCSPARRQHSRLCSRFGRQTKTAERYALQGGGPNRWPWAIGQNLISSKANVRKGYSAFQPCARI